MFSDRLFRLLVSSQQNLCVPIWSCRRQDRLVSLRVAPQRRQQQTIDWRGCSSSSSSSTDVALESSPPSPLSSAVSVSVLHGLPQVTVPLPSRQEPCVFTLKPVTHTVGDFLSMLRDEDAGIDRAVVRTPEGIRVASTTSIQTLMQQGEFHLVVNDTSHKVRPPPSVTSSSSSSSTTTEELELERLGDVRALVGQLYEALNVDEHQRLQEKRLVTEMEALKMELAPLEREKQEMAVAAEKRANYYTWMGLGMMSVQFGILARLTWWEYSWDIMEPVTYFVTYGTAMACYAYFVLTKQDYILPDVRDRQFLFSFHKKAKRNFWDVYKYNALKDGIAILERDLRRLRDPLRLRLSGSANPSGTGTDSSAASMFSSSSSSTKSDGGGGGILGTQINIGYLKNMLKGKLSS